MASPSGLPRPASIGEQTGADQPADLGSGRSYSGEDALQLSPVLCRWRAPEFHDQECSRYFDCPSHTLERTASEVDVDQEQGAAGCGLSTTPDSTGSPERTADNQSHQDIAVSGSTRPSPVLPAPPGSAIMAETYGNESISPPVRSSAMLGRSNGGASQRNLSRSQPPGALPSFLEQAGESYRAVEALSERPSLNNSGESTPYRNHGASAVDGDQASGQGSPRQIRAQGDDGGSPGFPLPRWQPDAEVTYCPICHAQFNIFVRKHHCRKCGRVVCNSCSPHRIIIPHQYIVRYPGTDVSMPPRFLLDSLGAGFFDIKGSPGGERVRLCNPCVPDPNTAPPQSPASSASALPRSAHLRSRSSHGGAYEAAHATNGYGAVFTTGRSGDAYQYYSPRWRSITMGPFVHRGAAGSSSHHRKSTTYHHPPGDRRPAVGPSSASSPSRRNRHSSFGDTASSSRHRMLPPPPQLAEEDECPICHRELPSRALPDFETLRERHISMCIQAHSTYGSPRSGNRETAHVPAPRRTGMYTYAATEKDCIDDAECTVCLEEFMVGVSMARLECLCRFHKACISAWFVDHPGRCPVHQHDGFGF